MLILLIPVTLRLIDSVNYLCSHPLALFLTHQSIFHKNINRQKILRTWEIKSCPNVADEPSFFAQIGQKRSQQCREDSHTAFLQSVLQRDLINNFKPGAFEWLADFTFNLLPYLHKGSCSLPHLNIAKGTTDPRVEFISQTRTQILIKFQFQNLDKALTSKTQPNISISTKR